MGGQFLLPPLVAWSAAQLIKVVHSSVRRRRIDLRVLSSMGGMPSSHSALVVALTTAIGRVEGVASSTFALALVFSGVVMYDAAGVRRAAGRTAAALNQLIDDLVTHRDLHPQERLLELLGHTPIEVLAGAALGLAVGLIPL